MYADPLHPLISGSLIPTGNPDRYFFGIWFLLEALRSHFYILAAALVLTPLGIYASLKEDFDLHLLPALCLVSFYLFFSLYPHKEIRFMLLFLPLIAYFASKSVHFVGSRMDFEQKFIWGIRLFMVIVLIVSSAAVYQANTWVNEDRRDFLEASESLEGTVVSNSPEIIPYSDFKFIPVRPENLKDSQIGKFSINSCTSDRDTGFCKVDQQEIDYIAINSCAWYCTPAIDQCESKIDRFSEHLKKDFSLRNNISGSSCNYRIYEADEK
jgi:hypothetical protein